MFQLQDGGKLLPLECIEKPKQCDGINDCQDGSDEKNCIYTCKEANQFQCIHDNDQSLPLECIPKTQYCDGEKNCVNGEDERNCPKPENLERIENKFGPDRRWNAIWSKYLRKIAL